MTVLVRIGLITVPPIMIASKATNPITVFEVSNSMASLKILQPHPKSIAMPSSRYLGFPALFNLGSYDMIAETNAESPAQCFWEVRADVRGHGDEEDSLKGPL